MPRRLAFRARPPLPREHGAWVMLIAPLVVPLTVMPPPTPLPGLLLCIAAVGAFCLQHVLGLILRRRAKPHHAVWLMVYLLLAGIGGVPLLLLYPPRHLLPIALLGGTVFGLHAWAVVYRPRWQVDRSLWGELIGAATLTLGAPAAVVVSRGRLDGLAWGLWVAFALFFTSGIYLVNVMIAASQCKSALDLCLKWRLGRGHLLYHLALGAILAAFAARMPPTPAALLVLAYTPIIIRALWAWSRLSTQPPSFKRVGRGELLYTVWFASFLAAWLRSLG